MDTFVYEYNGKDYINLTNKCTNSCTFCIRNGHDGVGGHELWLKKEPTADEVIELLKENKRDVVFCGFGEPLIKLEEMKKIAEFVKSYGGEVRVNTNGHANAIHKRDVLPELKGLIDEFSISLNGSSEQEYTELSQPKIQNAFEEVKSFIKKSVENGFDTTATMVSGFKKDMPNIEIGKEIAESLGAKFRVREFITNGY